MNNTLILVAGLPGAGKTRFADYLSNRLQAPLICKDRIKETVWDRIMYDTNNRDNSQIYGRLAYDLSFSFCETLLKTRQPVVFESNFVKPADEILHSMVQKYEYTVINVLFGGDYNVIHKRFVERDVTGERHPGLVSNGFFNDFEVYKKAAQNCENFLYGDVVINVDATDFSNIIYDDIVERILGSCHVNC
ncbi:MAG: ATP-binding protein [Defluviitaleaceae bacterium]|nr:ATP-binding protein [Defluviitaleaceae bacterium]